MGYFCDRFGPRLSYVCLLVFGAFAVAASSFAYDWHSYLATRLCLGVIGASFVIMRRNFIPVHHAARGFTITSQQSSTGTTRTPIDPTVMNRRSSHGS